MLTKLDPKKYLNSGCWKSAYRIGRGKVALIFCGCFDNEVGADAEKSLKDEYAALELLRNNGLPVVKTYGIQIVLTESGIPTPALIEEYIPVGHPNEKTVEQLKKIRDTIVIMGLDIGDFQYLVRISGDVVVNDPGTVKVGAPPEHVAHTLNHIDDDIENVISTIEYLKKGNR